MLQLKTPHVTKKIKDPTCSNWDQAQIYIKKKKQKLPFKVQLEVSIEFNAHGSHPFYQIAKILFSLILFGGKILISPERLQEGPFFKSHGDADDRRRP